MSILRRAPRSLKSYIAHCIFKRPVTRKVALRFRPMLEVLESRALPAVFTWKALVMGKWSDPRNWSIAGQAADQTNKTPSAQDTVVFDGTSTQISVDDSVTT